MDENTTIDEVLKSRRAKEIFIVIILALQVNSFVYLKQVYQYTKNTYKGTVIDVVASRSGIRMITVEFPYEGGALIDNKQYKGFTESINGGYRNYKIGQQVEYKSKMGLVSVRGGLAYIPHDPQYRWLFSIPGLVFHLINIFVWVLGIGWLIVKAVTYRNKAVKE